MTLQTKHKLSNTLAFLFYFFKTVGNFFFLTQVYFYRAFHNIALCQGKFTENTWNRSRGKK